MVTRTALVVGVVFLFQVTTARAEVQFCDSAYESCRVRLRQLIANETVGIDVAQWYTRDLTVVTELINKNKAGVPVRFIVDPSAETGHPGVMTAINNLKAGGIPLRRKKSSGVVHWKIFIFVGQNVVQFGAPNLSSQEWQPNDPFRNYRNENSEFNDDPDLISSLKTIYEDYWTNNTVLTDYANMTDLVRGRKYPIFLKDPRLTIPPTDAFGARLVILIDKETVGIDVNVMRFENGGVADALIRAYRRGVPVRLNTEQAEYRLNTRYRHAYTLDRLYAAKIPVRWRAHAGNNHAKYAVFYGQGIVVSGSSNWSASSDKGGNMEINYFSAPGDAARVSFYSEQFERRWSNTHFIDGLRIVESNAFLPSSPGAAKYISPANAFVGATTALVFNGGYFGIFADVYFGTTSTPPPYLKDLRLSANANKTVTLPALLPGTTYYWKVVNKTAAGKASTGPTYSFTTSAAP